MQQWQRTTAGLYRLGEWTVGRTEGEQVAPGYRWSAEHPEHGERFFNTMREAKAYVERAPR